MSAGKGDEPRPMDMEKFRENYDNIFRKSIIEELQAEIAKVELDPAFEVVSSNQLDALEDMAK
jgi:hypothetical protein